MRSGGALRSNTTVDDLGNMAAMNRQYETLTDLAPPEASGPSMAQMYQDWSERHPYLSTGAQLGVDYALSRVPYGKLLRGAGLDRLGELLDLANRAYSPGGFNPEYIRDPRLKWGEAEESKLGSGYGGSKSYRIPILDRQTDERYGDLWATIDRTGKNAHIDFMGARLPKGVGPGHLIHIKDELLQQFPELESVTFARVTGARAKSGAEVVSRTLPLRESGPKSYWHGDPTQHMTPQRRKVLSPTAPPLEETPTPPRITPQTLPQPVSLEQYEAILRRLRQR